MTTDRKRAEPMSNVDAAWLHMEDPTNLMMVTGLMLFDEPLEFERLKAMLKQRWLRFERFRQRVIEPARSIGMPHWETDPTFDLNAHVHRIALPAPHDQAALQELVSDLMSTPLDFSKPLWHFHLIEGYGSGCAVLARLHHCIADGIALAQVLLALTDTQPEPPQPEVEREHRQQPWRPLATLVRPIEAAVDTTLRVADSLLREGFDLVNHPTHAFDLAKIGVSGASALGKLLLMGPDPQSVFKGKLGVAKRAAWSAPIPLKDVKAIGRITGCTVNDVLLAAVTGGLRRYLLGRGEPTDDVSFRAVVPMNLRAPEIPIELGNHFGLVFVGLPIGTADSFERLLAFREQMNAIKGSPEPVVTFGILNAIGMAPNELGRRVVEIFGTKATAVMTNLPGPGQTLYLAGKPIQQIMFWVPQSGRLGLGVSILSYAGAVYLGVATDAGLVPDPDTIIAGFDAEFDELLDLVRLVEADGTGGAEEQAAPQATAGDAIEAVEALYDTLT
jgi:diacylglycerol O-acyltransferase / wax synthase